MIKRFDDDGGNIGSDESLWTKTGFLLCEK